MCQGPDHDCNLFKLHVERVVVFTDEHANICVQDVGLLLCDEVDVAHHYLGRRIILGLEIEEIVPRGVLNLRLCREHCDQWCCHSLAQRSHLRTSTSTLLPMPLKLVWSMFTGADQVARSLLERRSMNFMMTFTAWRDWPAADPKATRLQASCRQKHLCAPRKSRRSNSLTTGFN